jgi:cytochrome c oxidase subunit 1
MFTIGGISGVMHSSPPADLQQTDTYFIIAHFHYVLYGGTMMGIFGGIYYYFPKFFGRKMSETLGSWHFWTNLIGLNLTFFPMHYSGLLGMPRRIYQYDSGQGFELFNLLSSLGYLILFVSSVIFVHNFFRSKRKGEVTGNDPWGAPTLEWSIPSPPPEYNFAEIPTVTSRYPLWDVKSPELTTDVPHSKAGDTELEIDVGGNETGVAHVNPLGPDRVPREHALREERRSMTARELGIPMPASTAKPMFAALGLLLMGVGMLFKDLQTTLFYLVLLSGTTLLVTSLYAWLTSPLEDEH